MRRVATMLGTAAIVMMAASVYAQAPDFSGTWTVDAEKTAAMAPAGAPAGGGGGRGGGGGGYRGGGGGGGGGRGDYGGGGGGGY